MLLDWFLHGKFFLDDEEEAPVEMLLLGALKEVSYAGLRGQIEEALVAAQRERFFKQEKP